MPVTSGPRRALLAAATALLLAACSSHGASLLPNGAAGLPIPDSMVWAKATPTPGVIPVRIYRDLLNGLTDPTSGQNFSDPASYNKLSQVFGVPVPPASALVGSSTMYGGSYVNLAAKPEPFDGIVILKCGKGFLYSNPTGCNAAKGSTETNIRQFVAVQSWPLYVGAFGSSNCPPGTYAFQTISDDGSWIVVAPQPFTYAQPGNFQGATKLKPGIAVVNNGKAQSQTSVTGTFNISALEGTQNIYWVTMEYFEQTGGASALGYSWSSPGAPGLVPATQEAIYGLITHGGVPVKGRSVIISPAGQSPQTVHSDSKGWYGLNLLPLSGSAKITAKATLQGSTMTKTFTFAKSPLQRVDFAF